jgi:hypothetical protein
MAWRVRGPALVLLLLHPFSASEARAADNDVKAGCLDAYVNAQHLRDGGRLLESRTLLAVCARDPCPQLLHSDCSTWLAEVDRLVPSVVITVRDANGEDMATTRVRLDGRLLVEHLDGRPVEVDPGDHVFRFEPQGRAAIERRIVIHAGEKARGIEVSVPARATPAAPPAGTRRPFPWLAATLAGVSLLGAAGATYFGVSYLSARQGQDCRPGCTPDDERDARRKALMADVSAAIFLVAGGLAALVVLTRADSPRPPAVSLAF